MTQKLFLPKICFETYFGLEFAFELFTFKGFSEHIRYLLNLQLENNFIRTFGKYKY